MRRGRYRDRRQDREQLVLENIRAVLGLVVGQPIDHRPNDARFLTVFAYEFLETFILSAHEFVELEVDRGKLLPGREAGKIGDIHFPLRDSLQAADPDH